MLSRAASHPCNWVDWWLLLRCAGVIDWVAGSDLQQWRRKVGYLLLDSWCPWVVPGYPVWQPAALPFDRLPYFLERRQRSYKCLHCDSLVAILLLGLSTWSKYSRVRLPDCRQLQAKLDCIQEYWPDEVTHRKTRANIGKYQCGQQIQHHAWQYFLVNQLDWHSPEALDLV